MQYIDRELVPPPRGLVMNKNVRQDLEDIEAFLSLEPQQRAQRRPPNLADTRQVEGLKESLLELFGKRCAFCECHVDSPGIHRFRPSRQAHPLEKNADAPLYYLWFGWVWQNFYLACNQCNANLRRNFLVAGERMPVPSLDEYRHYRKSNSALWPQWPPKEDNLLLDPCQTKNFSAHIKVIPQGAFIGISKKGKATIKILQLNNLELVRRRAKKYQQYMKVLTDSIEFTSEKMLSDMLDFSHLEFGGSWYLLLRDFVATIEGNKGNKLSARKMKPFFLSMFKHPGINVDRLNIALEIFQNMHREALTNDTPSTPVGRLSRITFQNFKSLQNVAFSLAEAPVHEDNRRAEAQALLILGENATGKSSILEGIALALISTKARAALPVEMGDMVLSSALLVGEDLPARDPETANIILTEDNHAERKLTIKKTGISRVATARQFDVGPVFAYGAFRQYRDNQVLEGADKTVRNLFDGSELENPQKWLLSLSDVDFDRVVSALREVLSIEGEFDVIQRSFDKRECVIVTSLNDSKNRTPLKVASSGFRTVLAMVCNILQGLMDKHITPQFDGFENARGVVLIDEIEVHLHPRWKMQIMGGLRRALPGMTFVVTTHDPLCLRGMYNGEVLVMQRSLQDDTHESSGWGQKIETLSVLPDLEKMRVDQLLTSDFFQLSSTDEPRMDRLMAHMADLLAKRNRGEELTPEETGAINTFEHDIASAMPIGSSEAHRLVQDAVAEYLQERRQVSVEKIKALQENTRSRILDILRGVAS